MIIPTIQITITSYNLPYPTSYIDTCSAVSHLSSRKHHTNKLQYLSIIKYITANKAKEMILHNFRLLSLLFVAAQIVLPAGCFSIADNRNHRNPKSYKTTGWTSSATTSINAVTSSSSSSSSDTETIKNDAVSRNMFYDYDKPIVLIGCSSEKGNEIQRLAESFLSQYYPDVSLNEGITKASLSSDDNYGDIISSGENGKGQWPGIVVLDFSGLPNDDISVDDAERESRFVEMAEKVYSQNGLLSVYVNVDSSDETTSTMSDGSKKIKNRLEDDVFVKYSDYELCIKNEGISSNYDNDDWQHIEWELARLIARARLEPAIPGALTPSTNTAHLTMGDNTFFLSLSFPEIDQVEPYVEEMCVDVDAMEYRTDLLSCRDSRFDLIYGMQLLRRYCRPHVVRSPALPVCGQILEDVMPIVYTVRTENQAGTYPDDEAGISKMFDILDWGLRAGVECLDVESAWDEVKTDALLTRAEERYSSQILGSHHVVGMEVTTEQAVDLFQQCALDGRAHGAKVVLSIESDEKDAMAHQAALLSSSIASREGKPVIPNISLILGDVGSYSRIINIPFTPVSHESLPFKAAPGQMSASEIMAARVLTKIVTSKRYVILGHNIEYSVSPQMHGAAFAATRLPYQYGRADVETVEEFVESEFFKDNAFAGCSVTIPHKQAIIPYVDVMSDAASTIGSVNTLVVKDKMVEGAEKMGRVIYGDNTDWKGIFNPLERKLGVQTEDEDSHDYALILGGGGTARAAAYAASKLGLKRIYYNRTPEKAQDLADSFGGTVINSLDEELSENTIEKSLGDALPQGASIKVVISTLPAGAEFVLPEWILGKKPVVFDVNYKPYFTKLLMQSEEAGCQVVRGSEMLWEQGVGQFEAWTQRTAPYAVMKSVVLSNCLPKEEESSSD
jgi:shikimate-5-dehydrogenase/3-dehydroquinate dehydratase type I